MKHKTTARAIKQNYGTIISVGYCALQHLLRDERPTAYAAGVYGWNFDLYDIDGVAICTGYRGMPGVDAPYELVKEYETKSQERAPNEKGVFDFTASRRRELIREFISKCIDAAQKPKARKTRTDGVKWDQ